MAVTGTASSSTLAVRIRNGQTTTGDWRYKNVSITGIKDDFGSTDDYAKAGALYNLLTPVLLGTADGMRFVKTTVLTVTE